MRHVRARPSPLRVMGVLNVTPDSFWANSRFETPERAVSAGRQMFDDGAWAVDVGGESTRPGAVPVSAAEELDRVLPVVTELSRVGVVAVDTRHPEVAQACVGAGARIINDVSGKLYEVAARLGAGYVSMHAHSVPVVAGVYPRYDDVCADINAFVSGTADAATRSGASPVWVDPGIGFGKSPHDNLKLLRHLPELCSGPFPVLLGASRKSFLHALIGRDVGDRLASSLAIVTSAWSAGVDVIRVHDVPETVDVIAVLEAIWR